MKTEITIVSIIWKRDWNLRLWRCWSVFYPGQAGEVVKYLKKAGYADQEIGDLIDRTVGRDGRTEFLYKGDRERQHDRKIKSRGSGHMK